MNRTQVTRYTRGAGILLAALVISTGCQWRGLNSVALPGAEGTGAGSFTIQIQMPNITTIQQNTRVRVNDVNVGNITKIELQDWHALVTVSLNPDVNLPKNATATIGQTSLLGTLHLELAPPVNEPPAGKLAAGDLIPLDHAGLYPTTEQTLAAVSIVLNGGGIGQIEDINREINAALSGRNQDVRSLIDQTKTFTDSLDKQKDDIILALEGIDRLAASVKAQNDVLAGALDRIPPALDILNKQRDKLTDSITALGRFSDVSNEVVTRSKDDLIANLRDLSVVFRALADAGTDLTQSLGVIATFPWVQENVKKFIKGDYGNLSATVDLTMSRLDNSLLIGTPYEGKLTSLEAMLGRTVDLQPGPQTRNPLTAPLGGQPR